MRRLVAPALLLALACDTGFEPQYRVADLRILAVRVQVSGSTAADASPDDSVELEALVANPLGRTGLRVRWYVCAPDAPGALPPCLDPAFLRDPASLVGAGAVEIPAGPGTGERPPPIPLSSLPRAAFSAALDAARALAAEEPTYQCRVYAEIPLVVVAEAEGRREAALKRARLVPRPADVAPPIDGYVVNLNPSIEDAFRSPTDEDACAGGTSLASGAFPGGRTVLCGRSDAPGPFNVCGPTGLRTPIQETYAWQWYVTGGEFPELDGGVGNATGDAVKFDRPKGAFTLWVILRDGRGGEAWKAFDVPALP